MLVAGLVWQDSSPARSIAGGAATMFGALVEEGPDEIEAVAMEIAEATRTYFDDEGWAVPMASNIITALV